MISVRQARTYYSLGTNHKSVMHNRCVATHWCVTSGSLVCRENMVCREVCREMSIKNLVQLKIRPLVRSCFLDLFRETKQGVDLSLLETFLSVLEFY